MTDQFEPNQALSAAILAGGQSRRMGADKALLRLEPGGKTVIQTVIEAARAVSDDLFIVAPMRPAYLEIDCRLVPERVHGIGPLSGIEAALQAAHYERCLILACDLPLLSAALLRWLAVQPCRRDALVPMTPDPTFQGGRRPQPLAAIYSRRCLPQVSALIDSGERRLSALLEHLDVCLIEPDELEKIDPDHHSFLNLNTPEDLERVRRLRPTTPDLAAPEQAAHQRPAPPQPGPITRKLG